jgi:phage tail-like protein
MSAPFGTQLRVDTFTSESPKSVADIDALPESRWQTAQRVQQEQGEWDCLILSAPGRFLWLRLVMLSDGTETPSVEWIRVYYPRQTSLQFLPAAYSEDALGRDFLNRYLSIFDRISDEIGHMIGTLERYFDPLAVPYSPEARHDFLGWLASWLDLALDRHLPESRKRALLKNAHLLYTLRGKPEGLRLHLLLYFGAEPRILEHFKLRQWLFVEQSRLGDSSVLYGQAIVRRLQLDSFASIGEFQLIDTGDPWRDPFHVYAHQFTVVQPMCGDANETVALQARLALERIVEASKPAHTQAFVRPSVPRFRLDGQAYLGLDTVIGRYPEGVQVTGEGASTGQGHLNTDAVLGPSREEATRPTMRLGKQARIGVSTRLD